MKGTGKFLKPAETWTATQLFGRYQTASTEDNKIILNQYLQALGQVYGYDYLKCEINPETNEIIKE